MTFLALIPPLAFGQSKDFTDVLSAEVHGDTVTIMDNAANRNCGARYETEILQFADTLIWIQHDTGATANCMCTYDLSATVDSIAPGHYTTKVYFTLPGSLEIFFVGTISFDITKQTTSSSTKLIDQGQSACYEVGIGEIGKDGDNSIQVYPNPASAFITLITYSISDKLIRIFDIQNRTLLDFYSENNTNVLDISSFRSGIYFIAIKDNNSISRKKFCKY